MRIVVDDCDALRLAQHIEASPGSGKLTQCLGGCAQIQVQLMRHCQCRQRIADIVLAWNLQCHLRQRFSPIRCLEGIPALGVLGQLSCRVIRLRV